MNIVVPPEAMKAATQAVPGIEVDRAQKVTIDGQEAIEIIGKTREGKIRDVEVKPQRQGSEHRMKNSWLTLGFRRKGGDSVAATKNAKAQERA